MNGTFLGFGMPGGWEWILILLAALLIFGRRLPDVARSLGKSIVEFKKGIKDIESDIDEGSRRDPARLESDQKSARSDTDAAQTTKPSSNA